MLNFFSKTRVACYAMAVLLGLGLQTELRADNGECRWEGGVGAPIFIDCATQDCANQGGAAQCSQPIVVPPPGRSLIDVDAQSFSYLLCHAGIDNALIFGRWCAAASGTYHGSYNCTGVSTSSYYLGEPRHPMSEGLIVPTSFQFSRSMLENSALCGDPALTEHSAWGYTSPEDYGCWHTTPIVRNGVELYQVRKMVFEGHGLTNDGTCTNPSSQVVIARRDRGLACQAGYSARTLPNGDLQCFRPIDSTCPSGTPTRPASGSKLLEEVAYTAAGPGALRFSLHYSSQGYFRAGDGTAVPLSAAQEYWKHSYERRLHVLGDGWIALQFPGDVIRYFDAQGKEAQNRDGQGHSLLPVAGGGWRLTTPSHDLEHYDANGRLAWLQTRSGLRTTLNYDAASQLETVVDHFGRSLVLDYDSFGRLSIIVTPDNQTVSYSYTTDDMLSGIQFADQTSRTFHYEHPGNPYLLSGYTDERGVRLTTYRYDAAFRVIETKRAGDTGRTAYSYPNNTRTVITDALGTSRNFDYQVKGGVLKQTAMSKPCSSCGGSNQSLQYDERGNVTVRVAFGGMRTHYQYEPTRNLEILRTEGLDANGATTPQTRTVATQWHATWRLPVRIERSGGGEPARVETFSYDAAGNRTERVVSAAGVERRWTTTYDSLGRVTQVDGPRTDVSDVTTYLYYTSNNTCVGCRGQLRRVTNALNQITHYLDYDAAGRLLRIRDPNNVESTLTYDARGRLKTRTADATGVAPLTTVLHYDPAGLLARTQSVEGQIDYEYDAAQRLQAVADALGNRIEYVLDAAGNRTEERTLDPQGILKRQVRREIDALGRTLAHIGGSGQATHYEYDSADRVVAQLDPAQQLTVSAYDALGRLVTSQDPLRGETQYQYDSADRLTAVTDAAGLTTEYQYHPIGDLVALVSPDTGTTRYLYDAAGQRSEQTDARGVRTLYQYDALGRLTLIDHGSSALNVRFTYDQTNAGAGCTGSLAKGRLTRLQDASGQTRWCYDAHGRVSAKLSTVGGQSLPVAYGYDGDGRVITVRYPSGGALRITRDAAGRPIRADWAPASGPVQPVLTQISHLPFGPITQLSFGNGLSQTRRFDADYRLVALDGLDLAAAERHFAYDALQRVSQESGPAGADAVGYSYDAIGNRLAEVRAGANEVYTYAAGSHRLINVAGEARTVDAIGNTTAIGSAALTYDARNRLTRHTRAGQIANYQYNGRGERVQKQAAGITRRFAYDEAGHLLGEYNTNGSTRQEFLWLDDLPIGVVQGDGSLLIIQADHLQTPRALADAAGTMVWRWRLGGEAFGGHAAENDPDGNGVAVEFGLRYPGQYFDAESGLHYNYFRDYEPGTGRYVESDPIGLGGGQSTYAYVEGKPLQLKDSLGLYGEQCGSGFTDRRLPSGSVLCIPDPGDNSNVRRCSAGSLDCLMLGGSNPDSGFSDTNLCKFDRLGNNICYKACLSRRAAAREGSDHSRELLRLAGSRAGSLGTSFDFGLSLWDKFEDHQDCLSECNIDLDKPCECNGN